MVTKPRRAQGVHAAGNYISLSLRLKPGADGADAGEVLGVFPWPFFLDANSMLNKHLGYWYGKHDIGNYNDY